MPVIGIPVRYDYSRDENKAILYIFESLRRAIQKAGGDILLIVPIQDVDYMSTKNDEFPEFTQDELRRINSMLDKCDGFFLPGGIKFTPFDRYILDYSIKKDVPTLGVCLSMQMMSCLEEDTVLEKIESNIDHHQVDNDQVHSVKIDKDSMLYSIIGKEEIVVNSIHHYKARDNHIYRTVAKSPDGVIEAIEHPKATLNMGLQWHPEKNYDNNEDSQKILKYFIKQADNYSKNRIEVL